MPSSEQALFLFEGGETGCNQPPPEGSNMRHGKGHSSKSDCIRPGHPNPLVTNIPRHRIYA